MRKGFDGLSGLVQDEIGRNPLDGSVYIFINRRSIVCGQVRVIGHRIVLGKCLLSGLAGISALWCGTFLMIEKLFGHPDNYLI